MIEIKLIRDFMVVKETLERIGIANQRTKVITPTCYLIFKDKKYYISHFKYLLSNNIDKKNIPQKDINRQNAIITLLKNWNSIDIVDENIYQKELKEKIFVLKFAEKENYEINHKIKVKY